MMDNLLPNAYHMIRLRRKVTIAVPIAAGTVVSVLIEAGHHLG
jgi:hypothetical protein